MSGAHIIANTLTGPVDLAAPDPATITIEAIAHGLAVLNRWAGATQLPICVAQHSIVVDAIFRRIFPALRRYAIYALLHDGHEYVFGDWTSPSVRLLALDVPELPRLVAERKQAIDRAIRARFGIPEPSPEVAEAVHAADLVAADFEWKRWIDPRNGASPFAAIAASQRPHGFSGLPVLPWVEAKDRFQQALETELTTRPWRTATP